MDTLLNLDIESLTGIRLDLIVLAMGALIVVLIVIGIVLAVRCRKLRNRYEDFMQGENGQSMEQYLKAYIQKIEKIRAEEQDSETRMENFLKEFENTFQKFGLVKYDALDGMGGKLSFTLAMLNKKNTGFVLNAVHSNEGCYTYIKEIIEGNSVVILGAEEREAVDMAMRS